MTFFFGWDSSELYLTRISEEIVKRNFVKLKKSVLNWFVVRWFERRPGFSCKTIGLVCVFEYLWIWW